MVQPRDRNDAVGRDKRQRVGSIRDIIDNNYRHSPMYKWELNVEMKARWWVLKAWTLLDICSEIAKLAGISFEYYSSCLKRIFSVHNSFMISKMCLQKRLGNNGKSEDMCCPTSSPLSGKGPPEASWKPVFLMLGVCVLQYQALVHFRRTLT